MGQGRIQIAILTVIAVVLNVTGALSFMARPAQATHFRPAVCVTNTFNWDLCFTTVHLDGLNVYDAFYLGKSVLFDLRIPHVFVDYVGRPDVHDDFADGLSHTCWRTDGADHIFLACNYIFGNWTPPPNPTCFTYKYQEEFQFNSNGTINSRLFIWGPGDSFPHTYRVPFRADFDIFRTSNQFTQWDGSWRIKTVEGKYPDDFNNSNGFKFGYEWRNSDPGTLLAYLIDPSDADQFSPTEGPSFWAIRFNANETEGFGGLADIYVSNPPESIDNLDIVDWYTAYKPNTACHIQDPPYVVGPNTIDASGY